MYKLKTVEIQNFRSIEYHIVNFNEYGSAENKSFTSFILGVNESGKSNLLKAISTISGGFPDDYSKTCFKKVQDTEKDVIINFSFELINSPHLTDYVSKHIKIPQIFEDYFQSSEIFVSRKLDARNNQSHELNLKIKYFDEGYFYYKDNEIKFSDSKIDGAILVTRQELSTLLNPIVEQFFDIYFPEIVYWTPEPNQLINNQINLVEFKEQPYTSIPLLNIFHIFGVNDHDTIKRLITNALNNPAKKAQLVDQLAASVTSHVNKIWKEHQINFKFFVDGNMLNIVIEDKDSTYQYYEMDQRSEGFKQFVSFILSLSAKHHGEQLKNAIILIDEPENHLHPSGIRYMRDELLKIGKNNLVVVSTHSHFMVDTSTMERHLIVRKNDNCSVLEQLDGTTSLYDEEVVSKAFGIQIMKELIPKNIIIVEGKSDKLILDVMLKNFAPDVKYSIKIAGGSRVYGVASILAGEQFAPFVFLDADDEGIKAKADILKNLKHSYSKNSVKTISDLGFTKVEKASLEDLYPREFVKNKVLANYNIDVDKHADKPVIESIKIQDKSYKEADKQKTLKTNLSNEFLSTFNTKEKLETNCPELVSVCKIFFENLKKEDA